VGSFAVVALDVSSPTAAHAASTAADYVPVTPFRILDTRNATPAQGGQPFLVQVTGVGGGTGIPPMPGVTAVVLNVTIVSPSIAGFLSLYPSNTGWPGVSNLNFTPGQIVPNLVTVQVGPDGKVWVELNAGTAHVLIDAAGYYTTNVTSTTGRFHGMTSQARLMDTRSSGGAIGQDQVRSLTVT
jgi:hypothetical protein